jgi:hypothetical protein
VEIDGTKSITSLRRKYFNLFIIFLTKRGKNKIGAGLLKVGQAFLESSSCFDDV